MAFEVGRGEADELLRGILQSLLLSPTWHTLRDRLGNHLKLFKPDEVRRGMSIDLARQLILDIIGDEFRDLWKASDKYDPSLLREPYLRAKERAELTQSISKQMQNKLTALLLDGEGTELSERYSREAQQIYDTLIAYKKQSVADKVAAAAELNRVSPGVRGPVESFEEIIGKALIQTVRKEDFTIRLLSNTGVAPDPAAAAAAAAATANNTTTSLETMLNEKASDTEVTEIVGGYSAQAIEALSIKLRGTLLCTSLRACLWSFAFLTRGFIEAPLGGSNMRELARLAQIKGFRIGDLSSSPIAGLVSRTVANGIQSALQTTAASPAEQDRALMSTLARRSEILVHAAYILTSDFSERLVMVAILLMRVFPLDAPISEKVLKVFLRITAECLPSEHLHKEYSVASVAHDAWLLLQQRDPALHEFLQNTTREAATAAAAAGGESGGGGGGEVEGQGGEQGGAGHGTESDPAAAPAPSPAAPAPAPAASGTGADSDIPQSLQCLKPWLESGFLGCVPEHSALFLWDQLVLEGARPETFRDLLPVLCFCMLETMRDALLANPRDVPITECIIRSGRALRSERVIAVLKGIFDE